MRETLEVLRAKLADPAFTDVTRRRKLAEKMEKITAQLAV